MVRRLMKAGHECVVFDHSQETVGKLASEGATGASSLADFASKLTGPKTAWVMVPAGGPTEATVVELSKLFAAGDKLPYPVVNLGFAIFSPICPHLGCRYSWIDDQKKFVWPCHGSVSA